MADKPVVLPLLSPKLRKAAGQLRHLPRALFDHIGEAPPQAIEPAHCL
jgi:hypothetical protein